MTNQHRALVPAQFNLNDDVKVRLTDHGRNVLAKGQLTRQPDADGYTKFQLWELMNIFGAYLVNGCSIPFDANSILFAPPDFAMTEQRQHRATPEQWYWKMMEELAPQNDRSPLPPCILELRARVEAVEATQHAHADTSRLSDEGRRTVAKKISKPGPWLAALIDWHDSDQVVHTA